MSNAPTLEQVEKAIITDVGIEKWKDVFDYEKVVGTDSAAAAVMALYAPVLAELEQARAEVERLKAEAKETRRDTLLEISKAVCPHCKEGKKVHKDGKVYCHGSGRNVPFCRAPEVQAALEETKAPEVPNA